MTATDKENDVPANGDVSNGNNLVPVPEWVKEELFEELLKEHIKDFKSVSDFKAFPGLLPGENYATIMLRVEIEVELNDGNKQKLSYMLKVPHTSEAFKKMLQDYNLFEIESLMYLDVVPEFERMYRYAGKEVKFSANCYDLKVDDANVLLEDLRPRGFKNTNRLEGLDMAHMTCAIKKLAQWHAASAVRVAEKGDYPAVLSTGFFVPERLKELNEMFQTIERPFLRGLSKLKSLDEEILTLVPKAIKLSLEKLIQTAKVDPDEFNVLNHGDCWSNNIMFQYDDAGGIKETYFVDYQMPKYGTPAQDLWYMIISSASFDIRIKEFDNLIRIYHDELKKSLKLLKYSKKIPLLKEIHIALHKYDIWAFNSVSGIMAAVLCDPSDSANIENFLSESDESADFKLLLYCNPRYCKHMEAVLPWLRNRGTLEIEL